MGIVEVSYNNYIYNFAQVWINVWNVGNISSRNVIVVFFVDDSANFAKVITYCALPLYIIISNDIDKWEHTAGSNL